MTRDLEVRGEEDASGHDQSLRILCLGAGGLNSWLGVCKWGRTLAESRLGVGRGGVKGLCESPWGSEHSPVSLSGQ